MSISYTVVEDKDILRKAVFFGINEYVHAKVEPCILNRLKFPGNNKFSSCFLPMKFVQLSDRIFNFNVRSDDVLVCAFPKSGTTWLSNIIWQLQHNFDFTADLLYEDHNLLELSTWFQENDEYKNNLFLQKYITESDSQLDDIASDTSPRLIKTHLPSHFLPIDVFTVKPKLIYIQRNVKDVAISWFHMLRNLLYKGSIEDCFDSFLMDHVLYGPYHSHLKSYRQLKHLDHVLILTYEEMLANPFTEIKRISEFLNYTYSDDQLKRLIEYVSFDSMRAKANNSQDYNK